MLQAFRRVAISAVKVHKWVRKAVPFELSGRDALKLSLNVFLAIQGRLRVQEADMLVGKR